MSFNRTEFQKMQVGSLRTYQQPYQNDEYYFNYLDKAPDSNYKKVLLVGDFNFEKTEHYIESFLYKHELSNLHCVKNVRIWSFSGPCFPHSD